MISPISHWRYSNVGIGNQGSCARTPRTVGLYTPRKPVSASSVTCAANARHKKSQASPKFGCAKESRCSGMKCILVPSPLCGRATGRWRTKRFRHLLRVRPELGKGIKAADLAWAPRKDPPSPAEALVARIHELASAQEYFNSRFFFLAARCPYRGRADREMAEPVELLSFRPLYVFFVKAKMPVVHRRELSLDEQVLHVGGQFERVAVGHDDVGEFALLERAYLIRKAENLRGVKRDGLEPFFMRQSVRHGVRGVLAQPPREGIVEAREGEFHSGSGKLRGLSKQLVVRIVLIERQHQHRPEDYGNILRAQQILDFVGLRAAGQDHLQILFVAKIHGIADLARAIGKDQQGQFPANDRRERLQLQVAVVLGA